MFPAHTSLLRASIFILFFPFAFAAFSQKEVKLYEKGQENLVAHRYTEAYNYFLFANEINPGFEDLKYKLELTALLSGQGDEESIDKILAFEDTYGQKDDHYYYWVGQIELRRYELNKAVAAFEKFKQKVAFVGNSEKASLEMIDHVDQLKAYFDNPDNYEIHQLESPVNSKGAELSPAYFDKTKELLFASDRNGSGETPFKIYYTKRGANGWEKATEVKNLGNFSRSNANVEVVNEDGKLFLFREDNGGDIFYSQPSGDNWTTPVEFDARISNNHLASHFFINQHEDRIIFASDEKGAGLDLYESFRDPDNDKWSRPSPFALELNSDFDEDSPYLSDDEHTLYFSSNRPGGVGGFDVYVSHFDDATLKWSEPENMGWPINSPNDELHFKMDADGTSGYFVSDRLHSQGSYDIYFFWEVEKVAVEGRIFDRKSNGPLQNAEIRFHPSQYSDEYFSSKIDNTGRYRTDIISDEIFKVEIIQANKVIFEDRFEIHDTSGTPTTHIKDFSVN